MDEITEPGETQASGAPADEPRVLSLQETPADDGDADDEVVAHASGASYAECTTNPGF